LLYAQGYRLIAPTPPSVDSFINTPGITLPQVLDTLYAHLDPADTGGDNEAMELTRYKYFMGSKALHTIL